MNIFTVDVEEYYHAENISNSLPEAKIKTLGDRLPIGLSKILRLLDRHQAKATFFVLGCVAEKNKNLIKEISAAGHEIASHGYAHLPLSSYTRASFESDLVKSLDILSGITSQAVSGYRSTNFSLCEGMGWFFEILKKHQIIYDSSLSASLFRRYPSRLLNMRGCLKMENGILEFPVSFFKVGPFNLPCGGGYFRAYPYWLTKCGINQSNSRNAPFIFYIHPWELDFTQPRFKISPLKYFRHYFNLRSTEIKLQKLLTQNEFISIRDFLPLAKAGPFLSQLFVI